MTPNAIKAKLKSLDPSKAQGPDQIPAKVLKELSNEISLQLSLIYNKSLEDGKIPEDWKEAEVIAIFKKGDKMDPGNYRPVSLTCITCKVLESLIRDILVNHFNDNNLYSDCQHGFRQRRSCMSQLIQVSEDITKIIDNGESLDIIYLDFRKAFDSVPHKRLLIKLAAYGIDGALLKWIENFLSNRSQYVKVGNSVSDRSEVLSGIPQGSILGPVLFTIFINDLPDNIKSTCKIFADDTKIYNTPDNNVTIQEDLYTLQEWSDRWNLYFNVQKCKVMHVGKKNPKHQYKMKIGTETKEILTCEEEKDLGVTFNSSLSFDQHIYKVVNKANQIMGLIKRSFDYLDKETFIKLYKALVRPHLEYGNVIWHPWLKRQSIALERVQRRATKTLTQCKDMTYLQRLSYLNLPSLKGRRLRGDLIETYKILNSYIEINPANIFSLSTYDKTRNSDNKLLMTHSKTNFRKFSFSNRVVQHWNALPNNVKSAPNLLQFKSLLDSHSKLKLSYMDFDD